MRTLVQFIARIELLLYGLAAIGVFLSIRSFALAQRARRNAIFPLEREAVQNRQRRAIGTIIALILLSGGIYIVTNIVEPNLIVTNPPTPTPIIFVTQQPTPTDARLLYPTVTPTPGLPPGANPPTVTPGLAVTGCEFGRQITSPAPNEAGTGQVVVRGQANIINFAQYKFELMGPATGGAWVVVGTSNTPVFDGLLGSWDSTSLAPGNYTLRIVVSNLDGNFFPPCEVPIVLVGPGGVVGPSSTPVP
jgi:hypothetical protein